MAKKTEEIVIKPLPLKRIVITLEGDGELILHKMSKRTRQDLLDKQANKTKNPEPHNEWEDIATSLHWKKPIGEIKTEDDLRKLFEENTPCISAKGLMESFCNAVVRYGLDKYTTNFRANVKIVSVDKKIPIKFAQHYVREELIPSNTASKVPVRSLFNVFDGWTADVEIQYVNGTAFKLEQILQVIGYAGFGIGVGSSRDDDYGRFHIKSAVQY